MRKNNKANYSNQLLYLALVILLVLFYGLLLYIPDINTGIIKQHLQDYGYDISDIELALTDKRHSVYQSSKAFPLANGQMCDLWVIEYHGFHSIYPSATAVYPYPLGEWPEAIKIQLLFTLEEYEYLQVLAGNSTIDEYLKETILEMEYFKR